MELLYTITDIKSTCAFYLGLLWLRPPRSLTVGYACRGYQSGAAAEVGTPQPRADDTSGERVCSELMITMSVTYNTSICLVFLLNRKNNGPTAQQPGLFSCVRAFLVKRPL